jgi:hypothetical protein
MGETLKNGSVRTNLLVRHRPLFVSCLASTTMSILSLTFILFSTCHPSSSLEHISPTRRIISSLRVPTTPSHLSSRSARPSRNVCGCLSNPFRVYFPPPTASNFSNPGILCSCQVLTLTKRRGPWLPRFHERYASATKSFPPNYLGLTITTITTVQHLFLVCSTTNLLS